MKELINIVTCKRCTKCCYLIVNGKLKRCKHLVMLRNGTGLCRIYNTRLGKYLGKGTCPISGQTDVNYHCLTREEDPYDYPDCPLNTGKPIHPLYINEVKHK